MLNKVIKSISDNMFGNSKDCKLMEESIWKIYANQHFNMESSLRRWR